MSKQQLARRSARAAPVLVVVAALLQLLRAQPGAGLSGARESGCHLRELDLCAVGFTSFLQNPNGIPGSEAELRRQCEYVNESTACFEDYARDCLAEQQSALLGLFAGDLFQVGREFCTAGSELRANYSRHSSCLREVQRKHQRPCVADLQVGFEAVHKLNTSMRLVTVCCNLNRLKECILPRIQEQCGDGAFELVRLVLERSIGTMGTLLCRSYDPFADSCGSVLPELGTKPHNGRNVSAISRIISSFANSQA